MAANAAVATLKFIAATITGSSAMLSEAVHSLVDTGDSILLFVGTRLSRKPPDRAHPLGHGRELYFWSMVVAMIIFGAGGCVNVFEGIGRILRPQPLEDPTWSYVVLACAAVFDGISFAIGYKQFRKEHRVRGFFSALRRSKDPTTFAVIFEDGSDLLGIATAFVGIWLGHAYGIRALDGVASVIIGGILGIVAFLLGRECHGLLIGESADEQVTDRIKAAAQASDGVEDVGNPLTMYFGPHQIMLALPVRFRRDLDGASLAATIDDMECSIQKEWPDVSRIFIEPAVRLEETPPDAIENHDCNRDDARCHNSR